MQWIERIIAFPAEVGARVIVDAEGIAGAAVEWAEALVRVVGGGSANSFFYIGKAIHHSAGFSSAIGFLNRMYFEIACRRIDFPIRCQL